MNCYTIYGLEEYGDDFLWLKFRDLFPSFKENKYKQSLFYSCVTHDRRFGEIYSDVYTVCHKGLRDLFLLSIKIAELGLLLFSDWTWTEWNGYMSNACGGGHSEMAELIIHAGKLKGYTDYWNYERGLQLACLGGHLEIARLMIRKGAGYWNLALDYACLGGQIDMVHFILNQSRGVDVDFNMAMAGACEREHFDSINLMIEQGADDWNLGLTRACMFGNPSVINFMIQKGANYCSYCYSSMEHHLSD